MVLASCSLCGCAVSPAALDYFDHPGGAAAPVCGGCLALAYDTAPDGGPLPWELTCEVGELTPANSTCDVGEAA